MKLNRKQWDTLKRAEADIADIGRMRTSSEHFGSDTRSRDRMLKALRDMEAAGLVSRTDRDWNTGFITPAGRLVLDTALPPKPTRGYRKRDMGVHSDGGTIFKSALVEAGNAPILASGAQSAKLGRVVTKGPHKGLPMRYVTLEEGRTCPSDCGIKGKCYGGNMPLAKRIVWRGEETGEAIAEAIRTSRPALIRLHNLGDFPSTSYAAKVIAALVSSGSAAFGFTHHPPEDNIGGALRRWAARHWDRFAIRTSYLHGTRKPIADRAAVIVASPSDAVAHDAVVCPEQLGRTPSCAACGFCWHSQRNVAFVLHEKLRTMPKVWPNFSAPAGVGAPDTSATSCRQSAEQATRPRETADAG